VRLRLGTPRELGEDRRPDVVPGGLECRRDDAAQVPVVVAQLVETVGLDGDAHGARVAAEADEHVGALLDGMEEIDVADGTSAAGKDRFISPDPR
jgi:hypothetical protein